MYIYNKANNLLVRTSKNYAPQYLLSREAAR